MKKHKDLWLYYASHRRGRHLDGGVYHLFAPGAELSWCGYAPRSSPKCKSGARTAMPCILCAAQARRAGLVVPSPLSCSAPAVQERR